MGMKKLAACTKNNADCAEFRARSGCGQALQLHGCGRAQRNRQALAAWRSAAVLGDVGHLPNRP